MGQSDQPEIEPLVLSGHFFRSKLGKDALFESILPPLIAALAMGVTVMMVDGALPTLPAPLRLAVLVAVGGGVYIGWLGIFSRAVIDEIILIVRRQPPANPALV